MLENIGYFFLDLLLSFVIIIPCWVIGAFCPASVQPFMMWAPIVFSLFLALLDLFGIGRKKHKKTDKENEYDNLEIPTRRKR